MERSKSNSQVSILCVKCTRKRGRPQHVGGLRTVKVLVERDFKCEKDSNLSKEICFDIFEKQLNLVIDRKNDQINLYESPITEEF